MKFSFHNPTRIQFGQGQIASLAELIPAGARVLMVYGGGSIKANGVYQQVTQALSSFSWYEFAGVEANPTRETLDKAVALIRAEKLDFILAVGGGSVADGCKYIASAACYEGEGWDILTGAYQIQQALPLGVVLTLPATGSESNPAAVISNQATGEKLSFMHPAVYPRFAVLDPETMSTLPDRQLANGVVDAFVHVCEQYLTYPTGALVQDAQAEALLRVLRQLAETFNERHTPAWRANLMWAANQALNGVIGLGVPQDWATHMIGHELTAFYGIDHARTLAIVQPALLKEFEQEKAAKLAQLGQQVFGLEEEDATPSIVIAAIEQLYHRVEVPTRLQPYGLHDSLEQVQQRVADALQRHGYTAIGERGDITPEDVKNLLVHAW